MNMLRTMLFILRQAALIGLAVVAYFRVRGLTEDDVVEADLHAGRILDLERLLSIDLELGLQRLIADSELLVDVANWIYIWGHWPVIVATLVWLAIGRRDDFYELRNAIFLSGAIGLVIFATYAVTPPRLFAVEYLDTVTLHSSSYRVLQPPGLVNKYAAVPSLHFGWNLLVGYSWRQARSGRWPTVASVMMPAAMAFAVVATANHWTFDVIAGAVVAAGGLALEKLRQRYWPELRRRLDGRPSAVLSCWGSGPSSTTADSVARDRCRSANGSGYRTRPRTRSTSEEQRSALSTSRRLQ